MKKLMFLVLAILLLTVSVASAQETITADPQVLNFSTIADVISWESTPQEIYDFLSQYDVEISAEEDDEYGKTIDVTAETEDADYYYILYFDHDTEALWEIQMLEVVKNSEDLVPLFQALYEEYSFESCVPYENNESLNEKAAQYDEAYVVTNESTIKFIGANAETEESYGTIELILINKEYFES